MFCSKKSQCMPAWHDWRMFWINFALLWKKAIIIVFRMTEVCHADFRPNLLAIYKRRKKTNPILNFSLLASSVYFIMGMDFGHLKSFFQFVLSTKKGAKKELCWTYHVDNIDAKKKKKPNILVITQYLWLRLMRLK